MNNLQSRVATSVVVTTGLRKLFTMTLLLFTQILAKQNKLYSTVVAALAVVRALQDGKLPVLIMAVPM